MLAYDIVLDGEDGKDKAIRDLKRGLRGLRIKELPEEAKVSVRNVRRDGNKAAEQAEKDGDLTEDERDKLKDDIQELTKKYEGTAADMAKKREDEVMEG